MRKKSKAAVRRASRGDGQARVNPTAPSAPSRGEGENKPAGSAGSGIMGHAENV